MAESTRLVDLIQERIDNFLAERHSEFIAIAPELAPVTDLAHEYLAGGKRFRGALLLLGMAVRERRPARL